MDADKQLLMTQKVAAMRMDMSVAYVESLRRSGALPFVKIGNRIYLKPDDVQRFIDSHLQGIHQTSLPISGDEEGTADMQDDEVWED